jgi:hypothetical protein
MTIAEELRKEMKQDKEIEKTHGDHNPRIRETSTMWRTISLTRTTGQVREADLHREEQEGGEDPRNSQTTTQEIHISTTNIMEEAIEQKGVQKPRRILLESSKRR